MRSLDWFGFGMLVVFVLHGHYGTYDKIYNGVLEGLALQNLDFFERMAYELNGPKDFIGAVRTEEPLGFLFLHTVLSALLVQMLVWPLKFLADLAKKVSAEPELPEPPVVAEPDFNPSAYSHWEKQSP